MPTIRELIEKVKTELEEAINKNKRNQQLVLNELFLPDEREALKDKSISELIKEFKRITGG